MNKKNWAILIVCILLVIGWCKLFYKTWNNTTVPKSADCIIAIDVKKITSTLIWDFITTPSQWKNAAVSASKKGEISWYDMVKLPDYIFIFHKKNEPINAVYTVLEISNTTDFEKGLAQFHFEKTATGSYVSKETGIEFIQNGNKLLIANAAVENKNYLTNTVEELFTQKQFIADETLKKNIGASSHLSMQLLQNSYFGKEQMLTAGFDKQSIFVDAAFTLAQENSFVNNTFSYCDTSMCSFGFAQPNAVIENLLGDSAKSAISGAVNFNLDSLLLPSNKYYQLEVEGIHARVDSAISYTYDDNFNPVEKVVINNVEEPAFNFTVQGDSVKGIYNYFQSKGKIEKTETGDLFTPMPFVKSYCYFNNKKELKIISNNYKAGVANKSIECMFFLKLVLTKIPASLMKYIPEEVQKVLKNIESAKAFATNEKGQANVRVVFNKKQNDLPLFDY